MEEASFDTDLFIDKVEKWPAIWDMTSREYSNKISKRKAWEELSIIFCAADDNDDKKKVIGSKLQKKWKSLRDNYMREIKKLKNIRSGSEASKKSSYIHFKRLQFLRESIEKNDTESNFSRNNETLNNQYLNEESMSTNTEETGYNIEQFKSPNDIRPKGKKIKLNPADEMFANILEKSFAQKNEPKTQEEDEDKLFCLSLYKEIKKVPESRRLKTKIEIYDLILKNQNIYPQLQSHELQSTSIRPPSQHINYLSQTSLQSHSSTPMYQGYQRQHGSPATTNNSEESEIDLFSEL